MSSCLQVPSLRPFPWTYLASAAIPDGKRVELGASLPSAVRFQFSQQSSTGHTAAQGVPATTGEKRRKKKKKESCEKEEREHH